MQVDLRNIAVKNKDMLHVLLTVNTDVWMIFTLVFISRDAERNRERLRAKHQQFSVSERPTIDEQKRPNKEINQVSFPLKLNTKSRIGIDLVDYHRMASDGLSCQWEGVCRNTWKHAYTLTPFLWDS